MTKVPNEIETDLISFLAQKRNKTEEEIRRFYLNLKKNFDFKSTSFRDLTEKSQVLHNLFLGMENGEELIETYRFHSYLAILRFISYSLPSRLKHLLQNFSYFFKLVFRGAGGRAWCSFKRTIKKSLRKRRKIDLIQHIKNHYRSPTVVDYGCGLAYLSFQIALKIPGCRIVLVDVDSIMNEFARFRFQKHGIPYESLKVTKENLYPRLPIHQVCIADEVMEHLKDPLKALENIRKAMAPGGLLYGDYDDHCPELFHLHTDMAFFRNELNRDYTPLADKIYQKKN
jgi:SAM-dependent methyltransferase